MLPPTNVKTVQDQCNIELCKTVSTIPNKPFAFGSPEALQLIPNGRHGARCGCTCYGVSGEDTNKEFLLHYCGGRGEFKHEFCASDTGPSILYKTNSGRGPSQKMEQIGINKPKKTYDGPMHSQDYC